MEEKRLDVDDMEKATNNNQCVGCSSCSCDNQPKVREKANILLRVDSMTTSPVEHKGIDTGSMFRHINNEFFKLSYENISLEIDSIVSYDNRPEIVLYNKSNVVAKINIHDKTAILIEVTKPSSNDISYVLTLDESVYIDHDEGKFPRIRTEFYNSTKELDNSIICKIFIKPSSQQNEILAYMLDLPNMTREEAIFKSHHYINELNNIKDIIRSISLSNNAYIAGLEGVISIKGLGYGGLILESGDILHYHNIAYIDKSAIIFDRTLYTTSEGLSIKIDGTPQELSEDEMELIVKIMESFKNTTNSDNIDKEKAIKEYDELSNELSKLFSDNEDDNISIILNDDGNFNMMSLQSYRDVINNI